MAPDQFSNQTYIQQTLKGQTIHERCTNHTHNNGEKNCTINRKRKGATQYKKKGFPPKSANTRKLQTQIKITKVE